jgi:hypothetical protein
MYPEVPCPSRLLYSIYTGREAQCNTTNNHTQSILLTKTQVEIAFLSQNWGKVMVKTQKLKFSGQNIIRLQICYQNKIVPSCYQRNNRT